MLLFQVAAVTEGHSASQGQGKRVSVGNGFVTHRFLAFSILAKTK